MKYCCVMLSTAKRLTPSPLRPAARRAVQSIAPSSVERPWVAARLEHLADYCRRSGSPLSADLLRRAAADVRARGPVWTLVRGRGWRGAADDGLPMRLLGSVHRLVLEGRAPELARHYPTAGGVPSSTVGEVFVETIAAQLPALQELMERPVQTNQVGRCAVLLGGFLTAAADTGLPLRLLEVGASAGLNLRWPEYWYEEPGMEWGDPSSPVRFIRTFEAGRPPLHLGATVAARRGCDLRPLDASSAEDCLSLLSFTWPDCRENVENLQGALEVARRVSVEVDASEATPWLSAQLAEPARDQTTVVFHSFVLLYLDKRQRSAFARVLTQAGRKATVDAPVAHLSLEWRGPSPVMDLTLWPGGETRSLAVTLGQGSRHRWIA